MMPIPETKTVDMAFGNIDHLPKYDTLPEEFQRQSSPYCRGVSMWFFKGAKRQGNNVVIDGVTFKPKEGVETDKALAAIKACLGSWAPKHEHKIAGCGFMLSEWFDIG